MRFSNFRDLHDVYPKIREKKLFRSEAPFDFQKEDWDELYDLGAEEMGEGNYTEALTYFNAGLALEKVPNKQNLMKSAISAYEYSGDFASAKTMLADYLEQYPSDEDAQKESTFLETR